MEKEKDMEAVAVISLSRVKSYLFLTMVYAMALAFGILVYRILPMNSFAVKLLIADIAATVYIYAFSCITGNASVYDPYWSVQPIAILTVFMIGMGRVDTATVLVLIAVALWGIRLTANFAYNFFGMEYQDWRYVQLREKTGKLYPLVNLFGIHLVPTLVVYAAILPAVYVLRFKTSADAVTYIGFAVCIIAIALETLADIEMHKYRKTKKTPFIRMGLWKHSRHPNYLGEILMWWGIAVIALSVYGFRWYFIAGAVLNTLLFFTVSIPMAEKRQAKKAGYDEYRRETRMLLPIPRFKK